MSRTVQECASAAAVERRKKRRQRYHIVINNSLKFEGFSIFLNRKNRCLNIGSGCLDSSLSTGIDFVAPQYYNSVGRLRLYGIGGLGIILNFARAFGLIQSSVISFSTIFFVYELVLLVQQRSKYKRYPLHGYLVLNNIVITYERFYRYDLGELSTVFWN